jgi:CMP-N-acetylneuraminic acid synthetase
MKTACFIPIKANSQRVKNKNTRLLGSKRLFEYIVDTVVESGVFDNIYVDTDSELIKEYCKKKDIGIINRIPSLLKDSANGNDLLDYWIGLKPNYDIYYQIHVTSPFNSLKTIQNCVNILKKGDHNSIFTAVKDYTWFWFDDKPVNYDPKKLPRSQDAHPLVRETTCLYGIKKEEFIANRCRIGTKPYVYFVNQIEAIDIDNQIDFDMAEVIVKKGHHKC